MTAAVDPERGPEVPAFEAPFAAPDEHLAGELLIHASLSPALEAAIDAQATRLIAAIRTRPGFGSIEDMLREYSLSTKEGLALMVLAEALLRVPDAATADRLIEDKLGHADWAHHEIKSDALLVSASSWALGLSARIIHPGETPEGILAGLARRIGLPALRTAIRQAMRFMGSHFVFGETIGEALQRVRSGPAPLDRYSFDMLGEGARTAEDAAALFRSLCRGHRGNRRRGGRRCPAEPARDFDQAFGAEPTLRAIVAPPRARRARPAQPRTRHQRHAPMT